MKGFLKDKKESKVQLKKKNKGVLKEIEYMYKKCISMMYQRLILLIYFCSELNNFILYIYIYIIIRETNVRLILTCLYNVNMTIPVDTWSQWLPIVTLMFNKYICGKRYYCHES